MRLARTSNRWEQQLRDKLEAQGYRVIKRGWPDFLAVRGDEVRFIEVKPPGNINGLSPMQREVAEVLARYGIEVELYRGQQQRAAGSTPTPSRDVEQQPAASGGGGSKPSSPPPNQSGEGSASDGSKRDVVSGEIPVEKAPVEAGPSSDQQESG